MMIPSTETSSSVIPPAAAPMMGVRASISGVVVGLSNCAKVNYMTVATTSMFRICSWYLALGQGLYQLFNFLVVIIVEVE